MTTRRRHASPLRFMAYGDGHTCVLRNGLEHSGQLLSLCHDYARVSLDGPAELAVKLGELCHFDSGISINGRPLPLLSCKVTWLNGREVGVMLLEFCGIGVQALQTVMARPHTVREEKI